MVAPPLIPTKPVLTGQVRYRQNWIRKLVLQVEEQFYMRQGISEPDMTRRHTRWRDAVWTDLLKLPR